MRSSLVKCLGEATISKFYLDNIDGLEERRPEGMELCVCNPGEGVCDGIEGKLSVL